MAIRADDGGPHAADVTIALVLAVPFAIYVAVLQVLDTPAETEWAAADPILTLLPRAPAVWLVPVAAALLLVTWWQIARPDQATFRRGVIGALAGAILAGLAACALRLVVGDKLPAFIPPEESAAPGRLLSMTAGLEEELVCRAALLPALFFGLRGRMSKWSRSIVAVLATGFAFAVWHALGDDAWSPVHFATRFVIPGCLMSVVWLVSPSAVVVGHATAHLFIPALFV